MIARNTSASVGDRGNVRRLYLDGYAHGAMDLDDPHRHVFDYTWYFHLPFLFGGDVERVLFGGGFTGLKDTSPSRTASTS